MIAQIKIGFSQIAPVPPLITQITEIIIFRSGYKITHLAGILGKGKGNLCHLWLRKINWG
jgi:hypothetical protein